MINTRIIPCLLLKGTGLVKTIQFKNPTYVGDPINAIRIFNEMESDELLFLDINATKENRRPNVNIISKFVDECFMPLAIGGGIRKMEDIKDILNLGVEKISINTHAVEDPSFIKKASNMFGSQSITVSIDAKKKSNGSYEVFTKGGNYPTGLDPVSWAKKMEGVGAGEILINSIDNDGMMEGYDIELIRQVSDTVNIPVVACGGAGKLQDLIDAIFSGHASAVAAGSFFVFNNKKRSVLINYLEKEEIEEVRGASK